MYVSHKGDTMKTTGASFYTILPDWLPFFNVSP